MSDVSDRRAFSRRIVLFTSILVVVVLVGAVLFFLYWGEVDPLIQANLPITTVTTL
ncbi:MAG: hypothetical protein JSW51_04455 [Gemmatimonadota bacterium]|nr:MAG: hypothetical protein JSW51_04455 [Gemmatimonadota bacterium]